MKLYVLIQEVFAYDRRISATVLGSPEDYERDVSVTYPAQIEEEPCAENNWERRLIPTFDVHQLRTALQDTGYRGESLENALGRYVLYPHRDVTLSGDACHMPSIGAITVTQRTVEIEV